MNGHRMKQEFLLQVIQSNTQDRIDGDRDLNPTENFLFVFHAAKVGSVL